MQYTFQRCLKLLAAIQNLYPDSEFQTSIV